MKTFKGFEKGTSDGGFEKASKYLLEKLGYDNCKLTKATCDDGVDILATKNAVDFCVQCKNYDNKVGNDKIRDFGAAIKLYGRTNGIFMTTSSFTSEAIKTAKRLGIELWDYSHIKTLSNNLGFDLETLTPTRNRRLKSVVFEHNKPVYEQMKQMLSDYGKAIVTMGTGIGKTTTALEYCIENNCRALVVCPTNIVKDSWKNNKTNKNDRLLDTTTYQAFAKVYKDIDYNEYGVVIFDEVHHGGAETWGAGIKYLMENNIKVIGLTATEERTDGINVAEILFDNHIAEGLDILGGIREGIVYPFTYVGALYNAEQVCQAEKDKYGDKLTELLLGKLDMALNNTKNVRDIVRNNMPKGKRKGIIFSADIESMDDDIKFIKKIYPKAEIKRLHSNMSYKEQKDIKEWFSHTQSGYLCTIAMVNEGAHYEGVNTIFMLRKTTSELIFLQQLGRAITSVYGHKDPHTIVFDLVNSSKAIQNIKKKFRETGVEESVKAIKVPEEQYDAIIEAIDNGVITPVEDSDDIIEISSEDIPVLAKAIDVKIDLEKEQEHEKVKKLTRTVYVKNKVEFNTDYGKSKQIIVKDYTKPIVEIIEELHNEFDLAYWEEWEIEKVKNDFPKYGIKIASELPRHSKKGISHMAQKLGVFSTRNWTPEMDKELIENLQKEGKEIVKRFSGRSWQACITRARKLGIVYVNPKHLLWTEAEDDIILKQYETLGAKGLEALLSGRSPEAIQQRASKLGIKVSNMPNSPKELYCIELHKKFNSANQVEKELNINSDTILKCCRQECKRAGKFHWAFYSDYLQSPEKYEKLITEGDPRGKKVICVETKEIFNSYQEAAKSKGVKSATYISKSCHDTNATPCGYHWALYDEYLVNPNKYEQLIGVKHDNAPKKVRCIETNIIYSSISEASRLINYKNKGKISECCNKKRETAGGYHWEYMEEENDK